MVATKKEATNKRADKGVKGSAIPSKEMKKRIAIVAVPKKQVQKTGKASFKKNVQREETTCNFSVGMLILFYQYVSLRSMNSKITEFYLSIRANIEVV